MMMIKGSLHMSIAMLSAQSEVSQVHK